MDRLPKHGLYYWIYRGFVLDFIQWCLVSHDASVTKKCKQLKLKMLPKGVYNKLPVSTCGLSTF